MTTDVDALQALDSDESAGLDFCTWTCGVFSCAGWSCALTCGGITCGGITCSVTGESV